MSARVSTSDWIMRVYLAAFLAYLFVPLIIMSAATFNDSRFPTIMPWRGFTLKWFEALFADSQMWAALWNSVVIAFFVIALSVPVGLGAALLLDGLHQKARAPLYAIMVSPLLTPGVIIGISTLIFWERLGVQGGVFLVVVSQSSFIIAYVMLMVLARLQRFDRSLEEAALDLGASHMQAFRRVLLPHLMPAVGSSAVLAFFQSFENYNTTLFTRGTEVTLTIFLASKVRTGLTPAVNALGLALIAFTVVGAIAWEVARRREAAREKAARMAAERDERLRPLAVEAAA